VQSLKLKAAMAFTSFPKQKQGIQLLQRSLERGRLAHAYLFTGHQLPELEALARTLAKTLNCRQPLRSPSGVPIDSCDACLTCKKTDHDNHADVHWVRPESKMRIIKIEQMRDLMKDIQLKPTEAGYKLAIIVGADRLKTEAANAFLKTLEEPPPKSILILLTTDPQRLLETILSRCLRLSFAGEGAGQLDPAQMDWLSSFSQLAAAPHKSLLGRYRLLDVLLRKLSQLRENIEQNLTARSPLQQYEEAEEDLRDKWESELAAATEAEYKGQRADLVALIQWWLRDVWLLTLKSQAQDPARQSGSPAAPALADGLLSFPQLPATPQVARRISCRQAMENLEVIEQLQRWLGTNVQEALALEVGLLKLRLGA
jgi:DNA polymerase-3 subunit delta'